MEICEIDDLDMFEVAPSIPVTQNFALNIQTNSYSKIYSGIELLLNKKAVIGIWAYIVKRDFLDQNRLKFQDGIVHEDDEFTPRALYFAKKVRLLHFSVYYYFQREGSIMHSFFENRVFQYIAVANSLKDFSQTKVKEKKIRNIFISASNGCFLASITAIAKHNIRTSILKSVLEQSKKYKVYPLPIEFSSIFRFLIVVAVNISPSTYIYLLKRFK